MNRRRRRSASPTCPTTFPRGTINIHTQPRLNIPPSLFLRALNTTLFTLFPVTIITGESGRRSGKVNLHPRALNLPHNIIQLLPLRIDLGACFFIQHLLLFCILQQAIQNSLSLISLVTKVRQMSLFLLLNRRRTGIFSLIFPRTLSSKPMLTRAWSTASQVFCPAGAGEGGTAARCLAALF